MSTSSLALFESIISAGPVLLLIAIVIEHLYPLSPRWDPLRQFKRLSEYLALKVNRGSDYQRQLSGLLLSLTLLGLAMILLTLLDVIILFPTLFHLVILIFCLRGGHEWQSWRKVISALTEAKKQPFKKEDCYQQCKDLLSPLMLRELSSLSGYGLQKACLEALSQRLAVHWFGVIFYFLLLGSNFTLLYVLLIALAQQFNPKQRHYQAFGLYPGRLYRLFAAPPLLLLSLTLVLYGPMRRSLSAGVAGAKLWHYWASGLLLGVLSTLINHSFGGPRIYPTGEQGTVSQAKPKQRYPNISNEADKQQLNLSPLNAGFGYLRYSAQLWLLILLLITLFTLYFRLK